MTDDNIKLQHTGIVGSGNTRKEQLANLIANISDKNEESFDEPEYKPEYKDNKKLILEEMRNARRGSGKSKFTKKKKRKK